MKGFIEVTQIAYFYPDRPAPAAGTADYRMWVNDPADYNADPVAIRALETINVREIKSFEPSGTPDHPAPLLRHPLLHLFSGDRYFRVEESYEELKRRITEATTP